MADSELSGAGAKIVAGIAVAGLAVAIAIAVTQPAATHDRSVPLIQSDPPGTNQQTRPASVPVPVAQPKPATFEEALAAIRPTMKDSVNAFDLGGMAFAGWATSELKWKDVGVSKDETSIALVMKDSDAERGKRLCAPGSIVEIFAEGSGAKKIFTGILLTDAMNLVRYIAVGSSGALVAQSPARLCGVVIGRNDYLNSMGGTGHAVAVVGMFDLPENRKR